MPMIKDKEKLREAHAKGAEILESYLDQGKNVVYLTLGDPTVYCTFTYLQEILEKDGYPVELVPGITSFTAAAARLGVQSGQSVEGCAREKHRRRPLRQLRGYAA